MANTTYTAIIRWRGPDSALELETTHTGFPTPEEAALYANGIPPRTPIGLHVLPDGTAVFMLNDYTETPCSPEQLTVWTLSPSVEATSNVIVASENDFEPVHPGELAVRFSAQGDYLQVQYGVLDPNGTPLDVQIGWDDRNRLRVTVLDRPSSPSTKEVQLPRLGVLPIA
jgi:hypothetical protein